MIRHSRHVDGATADFDLRCRLFFRAIDQWYWLFVTGAEHFGPRREIDSEAANECLQHLGINLAECPDLDSALMAGIGGLCESARRLVDASSRVPESSTDRFESAWDLIQRAVYEELTWDSPDGWLFSDNDDVVGRSAHDFAAQMAAELLELAGERALWTAGEHEQWIAEFGDSLIEAIAELAAGLLNATIAIHEELRAQKCRVESLFCLPSDSDELFEVLLDAELAAAGDRSHRLLSVASEIVGTQPSLMATTTNVSSAATALPSPLGEVVETVPRLGEGTDDSVLKWQRAIPRLEKHVRENGYHGLLRLARWYKGTFNDGGRKTVSTAIEKSPFLAAKKAAFDKKSDARRNGSSVLTRSSGGGRLPDVVDSRSADWQSEVDERLDNPTDAADDRSDSVLQSLTAGEEKRLRDKLAREGYDPEAVSAIMADPKFSMVCADSLE